MGEGGCCGGCLAMILGIVGAIFAIAWGIIKFLGELFVKILGWIFDLILGLIVKIGLLIKDLYLGLDYWLLDLVGLHVWGVILVLIAIVLAIGLICVIASKIAVYRLKSSVKEYTDRAEQFVHDNRYWDAVEEYCTASTMVKRRQKEKNINEEIANEVLNDLYDERDFALRSALEEEAKPIVSEAEKFEKVNQFKEAAAEWYKIYSLAGGYWSKYKFDRGHLTINNCVGSLVFSYKDHYEKDLLNDVNLIVKPMISKAKKAFSQNDYLSSAKLYQKAAEKYRSYTPSVPLINSEAKRCESKYKEYIAKHVENQVKALEELDW